MKIIRKKNSGSGALIVILLLLVIGAIALIGYKVFNVRSVAVEGISDFTQDQVVSLSGIELGTNMFMLNVKKVKENIEQNVYLEVESVKRVLPDRIVITVQERKKQAVVVYAGSYIYIDNEGEILEISSTELQSGLPIVSGIDVTSYNLGQKIGFHDVLRFSALTEILTEMYHYSLQDRIENIDFSNINSIVMQESSGFKIKFGQASDVSLKFDRIVNIFTELAEDKIYTGTIDVSTSDFSTYSP